MKWMGGWGWPQYLACPISLRSEIFSLMREEFEEFERIRSR